MTLEHQSASSLLNEIPTTTELYALSSSSEEIISTSLPTLATNESMLPYLAALVMSYTSSVSNLR